MGGGHNTFFLTLYNFKNIGGGTCPPPLPPYFAVPAPGVERVTVWKPQSRKELPRPHLTHGNLQLSKSNFDICFFIVLQGLWKTYGRKEKAKLVVKDLFFGVEQGEVFGLLGPNGAGKTTTLKMITRDVRPSAGKVLLCFSFNISKYHLKTFVEGFALGEFFFPLSDPIGRNAWFSKVMQEVPLFFFRTIFINNRNSQTSYVTG